MASTGVTDLTASGPVNPVDGDVEGVIAVRDGERPGSSGAVDKLVIEWLSIIGFAFKFPELAYNLCANVMPGFDGELDSAGLIEL